jgi:hypothetical protein
MFARFASALPLLVAPLIPVVGLAQGSIPDEVIAECNAAGKASDLPECLKEGAIGYEMLALATSEAFFGNAAKPVADSCRARNESFSTSWTCFRNAAEKAEETRALIGVENIADACVVAISDPDVVIKLKRTYEEKREARFPDKMFFGGDLFYPFQGCSEEETQSTTLPADTNKGGAGKKEFDLSLCPAYRELEGVISSKSASDLRAIMDAMKSLPDGSDSAQMAATIGISEDSMQMLLPGTQEQAMGTLFMTGAFLKRHHTDLIEEFLENDEMKQVDPGIDAGDEFARAIFFGLLDEADKAYRGACTEQSKS